MGKIRMMEPRLGRADTRTAPPPPKQADAYYLTPEHRLWAQAVLKRAGYQCEEIDQATGQRCTKRAPAHRLHADHVEERRDGGADQGEGRALCTSHHVSKTNEARARRAGLAL